MTPSGILTLTSDFGYRDHYVSAMKAGIISIHPDVKMIDVSHDVPPQDIMAAAWVTKHSAFLYPEGTIHLVVVDPGVGTSRKAVAVRIKDQYFVGPDNGIFSLVADDLPYQAYQLSNTSFWGSDRSKTFEGRDIFAPVAAHLSKGVPLADVGDRIKQLTIYRWAIPVADKEGIQGWVVHIDRYGNLITNIPGEVIQQFQNRRGVRIYIGSTILKRIVNTFGDVKQGEVMAFVGSTGMLEVGVNTGNAEELLGVYKGAAVSIVFS